MPTSVNWIPLVKLGVSGEHARTEQINCQPAHPVARHASIPDTNSQKSDSHLTWIKTAGLLLCALTVLIATDRVRGLLANSAILAAGSILVALPVGTLLAVVLTKIAITGRRLLTVGLVSCLFVPLYVQATAWQAAIGRRGILSDLGLLDGWGGAVWVHGMAAIPWVVLIVSSALRSVPRELEEEALQDANAWQVLRRVSLRQASAGVLAAALWIAVVCSSEIAVTDLFQIRTFAEEIYTAASLGTLGSTVAGPSTSTFDPIDVPQLRHGELWIGTFALVALATVALTSIRAAIPSAHFATQRSDWVWQIGRNKTLASLAAWSVALIIVGTPILGLLGKAGEQIVPQADGIQYGWSATKTLTLVAQSPWQHRREFGWSLYLGATAAGLATVSAVIVGWALRSGKLPVWPTSVVLSLGFIVPAPLIGIGIIGCLNHPTDSWFASLSWCYDHTIIAPVLAQFLRALPVATLLLWPQISRLPQEVLDSARSEGAGWWSQLLEIVLPASWSAVVAAAGIALVVAIGELAATLLVAPPGVSTLSVRVFGLLHYGAEDRVSALCLCLIGLFACSALAVWRLAQTTEPRE